MQLFYAENHLGDELYFSPEETLHARRVLRKNLGDKMHCTDGLGTLYFCELTDWKPTMTARIIEIQQKNHQQLKLHLVAAPTKNIQRTEILVEKAIEFGLASYTPIWTFHSERKTIRMDRIQRIGVSAMKQSLKLHKTEFRSPQSLDQYLETMDKNVPHFIAHCRTDRAKIPIQNISVHKEVVVLIGPEGDFSVSEINQSLASGIQGLHLGENRLRSETAGIYVASWLYSQLHH